MKNLLLTLFLVFGISRVSAQLPAFGADLGKKAVMGKEIRVPYTSKIAYYGYVKPGEAPIETKNGKKFYYLYVWVPAVAPEIGVRMVSPIPAKMKPGDKDFHSATFDANAEERTEFFDTWVEFERADIVVVPADIARAKEAGKVKWLSYGQNDDSGEMPAQPSGSKYNSLLRITSEVSNPMKALVRGLYRIGFTTYKVGEVKGSFLAEIGAPIDLPGVIVSPNLDEVMKLAK